MRTSILARSAIAAATLAVTASALAATPATAATSTGVTRATVLAAADGVRNESPTEAEATATTKALRNIASRSCAIDVEAGEGLIYAYGSATEADRSADGVLVYGYIYNFIEGQPRICLVGATAAAAPDTTLSGKATVTATTVPGGEVVLQASPTVTSSLSRDVSVTAPLSLSTSDQVTSSTFTSVGTTSKVVSAKVATPKTAKQKKAAKASYTKKLKSAKKAYKRAVDKAGDNKSKKAKAKKTYNKKKKSAKASYKQAVATSKIVKKTVRQPFTLSASENGGGPL